MESLMALEFFSEAHLLPISWVNSLPWHTGPSLQGQEESLNWERESLE